MVLVLRGLAGLILYALLATAPALVALLAGPAPADALAAASSGLAWVGLAIFALEFLLVTRIHMVTGPYGQDALLQFHREIALVGAACVAAHLVLVGWRGVPPRAFVDPFAMGTVAFGAGSLALWALGALLATSLARRLLRLSYEAWLLLHRWLGLALVVAAGLHAHALMASPTPLLKALVLGYGALVLLSLGWVRVWKPWSQARRPWVLLDNRAERGRARTLVLRPLGHAGLAFAPGQFCWLRTAGPWAREAHPVSMSCSAERAADAPLEFTIKALGDWSGTRVPGLAPGARLWLDGPYGVFTPERHEGPGFVFIGGGVGVTPLASMVQTLLDRDDARPLLLVHAANAWEGLCLRERFEERARQHPNLRWVPVLESPPADWGGERGYVTAALLRRYLPPRHTSLQYFVCGPAPMMDAMERVLAELGVPADRVHTERYDMV
ncbi:MAG TPA: ferredoxin reductase family protein [Burkholderiaceae bacterium]|nr:ferredoxin reductase family protein [Burkholderiaceae bacterium]